MNRRTIALAAFLFCGGPALAGPPWASWEKAKAAARSSGRPILVYSTVGVGGGCDCCDPHPDQNRAMDDERVTRRSDEFEWVRCKDKRTAETVKVKAPPEIIAFDCDGEKIGHFPVSDVASIEKALAEVDERFADKAIAWGASASLDDAVIREARDAKKVVVVLFGDDKRESAETAKALEERSIAKHHGRIVFVRRPYVADSAEAARWGAAQAPTVVMIDPAATDKAKAIVGTLGGRRTAPAMRAMILEGMETIKAGRR